MSKYRQEAVVASHDNLTDKFLQQYVRPGLNIFQLQEIKAVFDAFDPTATGYVSARGKKKTIQISRQPYSKKGQKQLPTLSIRSSAISTEKVQAGSISKGSSIFSPPPSPVMNQKKNSEKCSIFSTTRRQGTSPSRV